MLFVAATETVTTLISERTSEAISSLIFLTPEYKCLHEIYAEPKTEWTALVLQARQGWTQ